MLSTAFEKALVFNILKMGQLYTLGNSAIISIMDGVKPVCTRDNLKMGKKMDGGYLQIQKQDSAIKDFSKKGNLMGSGY